MKHYSGKVSRQTNRGGFPTRLMLGKAGSGMGRGGRGCWLRLSVRCFAALRVRYWSLSSSSLK